MKQDSTDEITTFLSNIVYEIKAGTISPKLFKRTSEFYRNCVFEDELEGENEEINQADLLKFISLGWYVYNVLLKEK